MSLLPLASTVALLAMTWTYVSPTLGILTWPAFIGWAVFFIAGGDANAIKKGGLPMLLGVVLAWGAAQVGSSIDAVPLAIGVIAFGMVMLANIGLFALIPAQFIGAAIFFGTGADLAAALISTPIGLALGYVSARIPQLFSPRRSS